MNDPLRFERRFQTPYDWHALLTFLSSRTIEGVEEVDDSRYRRALRLERDGLKAHGWIDVGLAAHGEALEVEISPTLRDVREHVVAVVDHAMDVAVDPLEVVRVLGPLAQSRPGLRVPGAFDGFEIAVRAILGQQITVKAARTLAKRFALAFGTPIETPFPGIVRLFPRAAEVASIDAPRICELGIIRTRAETILALAGAIASGELRLHPGADVTATVRALRAVRGIGEWTAQYIAMRALDDADAFPHTDLGVIKALGERNPKRVLAAGEAWRPWRAYAVMHLWHT